MTTAAENRTRSDSPRRRTAPVRSGNSKPQVATGPQGDLPVLIRLPNFELPRGTYAPQTKSNTRTKPQGAEKPASERCDKQRTRVKSSAKTQPATFPAPAPATTSWGTIFWKAAVLAAAIALVALAYRIINGPSTTLPLSPPEMPASMVGKAGKNQDQIESPKIGNQVPLLNSSPLSTSPAAPDDATANAAAPASFSDPATSPEPVEAAPPSSNPHDLQSPWSQSLKNSDTAGEGSESAARIATGPPPQRRRAPWEIEPTTSEDRRPDDPGESVDARRPWATPGVEQSQTQPSPSQPYQPHRHDDAAGADPWSAGARPIHAQTPDARGNGFGQREPRREQYEGRTNPAPYNSGDYDYLETDPSSYRQPGDWEREALGASQQPTRPFEGQWSGPRDNSRNPGVRGNVRDDYGAPGTARLQGGIEQPPLR
jgi:hypothetical protein